MWGTIAAESEKAERNSVQQADIMSVSLFVMPVNRHGVDYLNVSRYA